jgi:hypothetical protein
LRGFLTSWDGPHPQLFSLLSPPLFYSFFFLIKVIFYALNILHPVPDPWRIGDAALAIRSDAFLWLSSAKFTKSIHSGFGLALARIMLIFAAMAQAPYTVQYVYTSISHGFRIL